MLSRLLPVAAVVAGCYCGCGCGCGCAAVVAFVVAAAFGLRLLVFLLKTSCLFVTYLKFMKTKQQY